MTLAGLYGFELSIYTMSVRLECLELYPLARLGRNREVVAGAKMVDNGLQRMRHAEHLSSSSVASPLDHAYGPL